MRRPVVFSTDLILREPTAGCENYKIFVNAAGRHKITAEFYRHPLHILMVIAANIYPDAMSPTLEKESLDRLKQNTARLSVISNTGLVLMKFVIGFAIGSVSIISEAIHSSMDLIAAVIAFFSVRKSAEPPDAAHEFGHGKFEDISGLIEALLIFVAAILIIYEAAIKLLGHATVDCGLKCLSLVSQSWEFLHWRTGMSPTGSLSWQKSRSPLRSRAMPGTCGPMCTPHSGFLPASS